MIPKLNLQRFLPFLPGRTFVPYQPTASSDRFLDRRYNIRSSHTGTHTPHTRRRIERQSPCGALSGKLGFGTKGIREMAGVCLVAGLCVCMGGTLLRGEESPGHI
jgi:hypothetical protein